MSSSGGGGCAACQLLQRACVPGCVFAPHFPAGDDPYRFSSVHAAFGANNVAHFLNCFPTTQRGAAVHWLVLNAARRLPSAAAASGGGTPPCAACLHLHETCEPGCVFAPYFPAGDDPATFALVDAKFGAEHVALILCGLSPLQREEAARQFVRRAREPSAAAGPQPLEPRPPCSACTHLRRTCVPNCVFWPYYPPDDDPKKFADLHEVYGATNLDRLLRHLPPEMRAAAAASSEYEARRRQRDPVFGVAGDVLTLHTANRMAEEQLANTRKELVRHIGEEATSRLFVRADHPPQMVAPGTMQEMEDRVLQVGERVMRQVAADALAGVTNFVTPHHARLVQAMMPAAPTSTGMPGSPGPAQSGTDTLMQQQPSQDPGLPDPEGEDADASDDMSQGSS